MNEYTINQPIGSTVSDHDITHRLHNGKCLDCPKHNGDNPDVCTGCSEHKPIFSTGANPPPHQGGAWNNNPVCPDCLPYDKCQKHGLQTLNKPQTLTPLGEALQANCPRCNMRWIIHNCPQYPKLLDAKEMIMKIARGAVLQELAENADYFTSIKQDGEEFNVYVREYKKVNEK